MIEDLAFPEPNSGCFIWMGATNSKGYSTVMRPTVKGERKRWTTAHKRSYEEWNGEVPEGLQVRHRCGNRLCVNHEHLLVGTQAENEADKKLHGTFRHHKPLRLTCKRGHSLRGEGSDVWVEKNGHVHCNRCRRLNQRKVTL